MINSNFISVRPPMDLDDAQLALNGDALRDELAKIDANGWHENQRIGKSSRLRVSVLCCKFREEILALSLGSSPDQDLQDRA